MHRFQYIIILTVKFILLLFPEKIRFAFAEKIGILGYYLIKKRRNITLANIKLAFPEKNYEERIKIAKESYKIMGKTFISTFWFQDYIKRRVEFHNFEVLENFEKKGKKVAVALMHFGNMETVMKASDVYRVVTVAKRQRNPYIDKYITESRSQEKVTLLKKSKTTSKDLFESIEFNDIIALFSDQRGDGTDVKFFNEETTSPTGIIFIALRYKLPLIICYSVFNKDNSSTIYMTEEIELIKTGSFKNDVKVNTQLLIENMENIIRKYPEQWMWFHDRWKLSKKLKEIDINN